MGRGRPRSGRVHASIVGMVQLRLYRPFHRCARLTATLAETADGPLTDSVTALGIAWRLARQHVPHRVMAAVVVPSGFDTVVALPCPEQAMDLLRRLMIGHARALPPGQRPRWQVPTCTPLCDAASVGYHVDAVHRAPLRHGLVCRLRDWHHSSFHRYVRHGLLAPDWPGTPGEDTDALTHAPDALHDAPT